MAKAKKEIKMTLAKKAVKTALPEGQARKQEEFTSFIFDIIEKMIPEKIDVKTRKRWKSLAGQAVLRKELEKIFSNLDLSIDEMEEKLFQPVSKNIFEYRSDAHLPVGEPVDLPELTDIFPVDIGKEIAGGMFHDEEQQRRFFDAGPADEHWSGVKKEEASKPERKLMPGLISNAQEDAEPINFILEMPEEKSVNETQAIEVETLPTDPFADLMKEQEEFYRNVFREEIDEGTVNIGDFREVKCPIRMSGLFQLLIVARGITPLILFRKCMKYFPCYSKKLEDYEFVRRVVSKRNASECSYAVWTDRRLNSDKEFVGISPARLRANNIPTMTFEERALHDLFRFYRDAKEKGVKLGEYDMKNFARVAGVGFQYDEATLCVGSKVNDPEKKKGNTVLYMWVDRRFAFKIWEPKDWPMGVDEREAEKRYLQNMRAHRVSVEIAE